MEISRKIMKKRNRKIIKEKIIKNKKTIKITRQIIRKRS